MGRGAEHLPTGSSSSGFVFRHLFCLLCWSGHQMKMAEAVLVYKLCCVVAQQLICARSSCCVYKGLKVQWSKWKEGEPVALLVCMIMQCCSLFCIPAWV